MSVEDLLIHFQYTDDDEAPPTETNDNLAWARQYYMPGDIMKGVVSLHLRSMVRVRALTLHLLGTASVSWEAPRKKKVYQSSEVHLESAYVLMDGGYDQATPLGHGLHQFGFQYRLPPDLPSTFSGVYGQVTYLAKLVLECEDERDTTITSEPFMVLRRPDLPDRDYEEVVLKKKRFFWGFSSGKIHVQCKIDKSAAVPGDDVIIDAEVVNYTGREINLIQACIMQESKFKAQGHELMFSQCLSKRDDVYDVGIVHGRRWHSIRLPVPPFLADSGLEKCSIMDVKYYFTFKVSIEGKDDIMVMTPLFVGSHNPTYGPAGRDLLLGRMWNSLGLADQARSTGPRNRSAYTESINGDVMDSRLYRDTR